MDQRERLNTYLPILVSIGATIAMAAVIILTLFISSVSATTERSDASAFPHTQRTITVLPIH